MEIDISFCSGDAFEVAGPKVQSIVVCNPLRGHVMNITY